MTQKTKVVLIVIGALLIGGTATAIILNNRKKKTPTKPKRSGTILPIVDPIIYGGVTGDDVGALVESDWDDMGGYHYLFVDGQQDYYRKDDTYVGSRDKSGNGIIVNIGGKETNCKDAPTNTWCK